MEVGRDPRAHALDRQRVAQPAAVERIGDGDQQERNRGEDLRPLPEGGTDPEVDDRLRRADRPRAGDAADPKAIAAGRQARVDDRGLGCRRTPVAVDAVHAVLIARPASRGEVQGDEMDFDRRRLRGARGDAHAGGADLGQRLGEAVHDDARDADRRRKVSGLRGWRQARQPFDRSEPQVAIAVRERGLDHAAREPVVGRVVLDVAARRIDAIEAFLRSDVDAAQAVLGDRPRVAARESLCRTQRQEPRGRVAGPVHARESGAARRDPEAAVAIHVEGPDRARGQAVLFAEERDPAVPVAHETASEKADPDRAVRVLREGHRVRRGNSVGGRERAKPIRRAVPARQRPIGEAQPKVSRRGPRKAGRSCPTTIRRRRVYRRSAGVTPSRPKGVAGKRNRPANVGTHQSPPASRSGSWAQPQPYDVPGGKAGALRLEPAAVEALQEPVRAGDVLGALAARERARRARPRFSKSAPTRRLVRPSRASNRRNPPWARRMTPASSLPIQRLPLRSSPSDHMPSPVRPSAAV